MTKSKKYLLKNIVAAALLCAGLASCSHDDMPDDGTLAYGKYPLEFTASVEGMQSRASGKDVWTDGDEIGVRIGAYDAVGRYRLNADGSVKEVVTPVYWRDTLTTYVKAWYPYTPQENVDISDQSHGLAAFDFLAGTAEGLNYKSSTELILLHSMAKVSCILQKGDGVTDEDLAAATVRIAGYTKASFAEGELAGSGDGWITPASDGDALLVPQDMTGKPFIQVSFNGKIHTYTPDNELHGKLIAGYHNSYTIIMTADGIEVTETIGGEWSDSGSENAYALIYKTDLTTAKVGDYITASGTLIEVTGSHKLTECARKQVIGIVFHVGHNEYDLSDYSSTGIGSKKCHGYAVALQDVRILNCKWGHFGTLLGCYPTDASGNKQDNYSTPDIDWSGYDWTKIIVTAAGGKDKLNHNQELGYPATYYAVVYYESKFKAPANSSGWFLPSIGQMWNIYQNRTSLLVGKDGTTDLKSDYYWSSSESYANPRNLALFVNVDDGNVGSFHKNLGRNYVLPVLAF